MTGPTQPDGPTHPGPTHPTPTGPGRLATGPIGGDDNGMGDPSPRPDRRPRTAPPIVDPPRPPGYRGQHRHRPR